MRREKHLVPLHEGKVIGHYVAYLGEGKSTVGSEVKFRIEFENVVVRFPANYPFGTKFLMEIYPGEKP